jgi:hypothetical protein
MSQIRLLRKLAGYLGGAANRFTDKLRMAAKEKGCLNKQPFSFAKQRTTANPGPVSLL